MASERVVSSAYYGGSGGSGGGGGGHRGLSPDESFGSATSYRRASRRNAPRRFACDWPGCDKIYSRSEHLQRHILNHAPREIYACDEPGCDHKFVRSDLLARHKKRHSPTYIPRTRNSSIADNAMAARATAAAVAANTTATMSPKHGSSSPPEAMMGYDSTGLGVYGSRPFRGFGLAQQLSFDQHYEPIQEQPYEQQYLHTPPHFNNPFSAPAYTAQDSTPRSQIPFGETQASVATYSNYVPTTTWEEVPRHPQMDGSILTIPSHTSSRGSSQALSAPFVPDHEIQMPPTGMRDVSPEDFAIWLFDAQRAQYETTSVWTAPVPTAGLGPTLDSNHSYEQDGLDKTGQQRDGAAQAGTRRNSSVQVGQQRRIEVIAQVTSFLHKQPSYKSLMPTILRGADGGEIPSLSSEVLGVFVHQFWQSVAPRMPIIHQPSFTLATCSLPLLLVIAALGASLMDASSSSVPTSEYRALADLIITCVRWDILTADEASPPIQLWVAQSLVLVEFYEKMYSTRKLHERAHIYHTAAITLLRRGSPLTGLTPGGSPAEPHYPQANIEAPMPAVNTAAAWARWAETEAMHRVVYGAFMMDVIHAAMFGHTADMTPQEIRLPLPCDDRLWTAAGPEAFRRIDVNLKSNGTQSPELFLIGLRNAIHGKDINTHPFGRMIIMCGLLSVGWHLRNRETHLKWLELQSSSASTREQWSRMLLRAFDNWKASFDRTQSFPNAAFQGPHNGSGPGTIANGPIESAELLYHLARISLHVNIVDCQVFAGAKHVLGRKISDKEYRGAVSRMGGWATKASTRLSVLHSIKLLRSVLLADDQKAAIGPEHASGNGSTSNSNSLSSTGLRYSCFGDTDPHRPWCIYYATLCIWAFVQAQAPRDGLDDEQAYTLAGTSGGGGGTQSSQMTQLQLQRRQQQLPAAPGQAAMEFLDRVAGLQELDAETAGDALAEGLPDLLDLVMGVLAEARSEILQEARHRLVVCREMLEQR